MGQQAIAQQSVQSPVHVLYDTEEDVLYVSKGAPVACYVEEGTDGLHYRFAYNDQAPSGVTVIAFLQDWRHRREEAYAKMSEFLGLGTESIRSAVEPRI